MLYWLPGAKRPSWGSSVVPVSPFSAGKGRPKDGAQDPCEAAPQDPCTRGALCVRSIASDSCRLLLRTQSNRGSWGSLSSLRVLLFCFPGLTGPPCPPSVSRPADHAATHPRELLATCSSPYPSDTHSRWDLGLSQGTKGQRFRQLGVPH